MGKAERDKGLRGEYEVKNAFEAQGFEIRSLEGEGDNLVMFSNQLILHLETKRQEKLRLELWSKQAEAEAPPHATACVVYRRTRQPWRVSLTLNDFLAILKKLP